MANQWFRMYAEFATDPKVQMLPEAMQRRLVMLFCMRCGNDGVTLQNDEIAFQLRISEEEWAATKQIFVAKGFIDESACLQNWDKRQFVSDSSAERVRRHREKRKANGLPPQVTIPAALRQAVYERDGGACVYCGSDCDLTLDHATPESRGGDALSTSNLLTACRACNGAKRDLTLAEYADRIGDVTLLKRASNALEQKQNRTNTEEKKEHGAPAPKGERSPTGSRLPADWKPDAELTLWTARNVPSVNVGIEAEKFRDYWHGKAGKDGRKADWPATWRNWVRRAAERVGAPVQAQAAGGGRKAL